MNFASFVGPFILGGVLSAVGRYLRRGQNAKALALHRVLQFISLEDKIDSFLSILIPPDSGGKNVERIKKGFANVAEARDWAQLAVAVKSLLESEEFQLMGLSSENSELTDVVKCMSDMSKEDWEQLRLACCAAADACCKAVEAAERRTANAADSRSGTTSKLKKAANEVPPFVAVKVLYATDRLITVEGEYIRFPSPRRSLHYGYAKVSIPGQREAGSSEVPDSTKDMDPTRHLGIISMDTEWREKVESLLLELDGANGTLLFIHGFNVSHKAALLRGAQLKKDLNFLGSVICYTWGSRERVLGYRKDETTIQDTTTLLCGFIEQLLDNCKVQDGGLHIIAHSMGTRAVAGALAEVQNREKLTNLKTVTLAAADLEYAAFEKTMINFLGLEKPSPSFTIYCSMDDRALSVSKYFHKGEVRIGDSWSLLKAERNFFEEDIVDVTGQDTSILAHSYYGDIPAVIQDLQGVLRLIKPGNRRLQAVFNLEEEMSLYSFPGWEEKRKLAKLVDNLRKKPRKSITGTSQGEL